MTQRLSPAMIQSAVGLMLLASLGALIGLILWIKNIGFGGRSYQATIIFPNAGGMTTGTRVSYRGVRVGRVIEINPEPEGVAIKVDISPASLLIPSNSLIEAVQAGLVGETSIDIVPLQSLPPEKVIEPPLDEDCDSSLIICDGSRLQGQGKLDVNTLIRSLLKISNIISDPEVTAAVRSLFQRSSLALDNLSQLSGEAAGLLTEAQQTGSVRRLNVALNNIGQLTEEAVSADSINNLNTALRSLEQTSDEIRTFSQEATTILRELQESGGISRIDTTLASVDNAAQQIDQFFNINQTRLATTVESIQQTSDQLRTTVGRLDPILSQVEQGEIIRNLETISSNTATLTGDLQTFSRELNNPETVLMLRQILDSARSVFDNLQKVTSDVDEITGNPQLRRDLIRLIQGLSNLVSSTQHLQEQVHYAQLLDSLSTSLESSSPSPSQLAAPKVITPEEIKRKSLN